MANDGNEAKDLSRLGGSLVVNMGSCTPSTIDQFVLAISAYNNIGRPVLLDPVGAGATSLRKAAVRKLMSCGYFSIIKGNEKEISTIWAAGVEQQKGVDSGDSDMSHEEKGQLVKDLAAREGNVMVMTGIIDYVSDGETTLCVKNGNQYLGLITGTGCTLGTTIAAFAAVESNSLLAALAGLLLFEIAAEHASEKPSVRGPGTFMPAFVDSLHELAKGAATNDNQWLKAAKVEIVELEQIATEVHQDV